MTGELVVIAVNELDRRIEAAVRRVLGDREPAPEWIDTKQAAAILGCHIKTAAAMARRGEVPATRLGNQWRFRRRDLESYLAGGGE